LLSLRQSIKEIEKAEVAHSAAAKAFAEALETSVEHVVEVNRPEAEEFRQQVLSLAERASHSAEANELVAARSAFRGELREYSLKAGSHITRLREELEGATIAMRTFAESVSTSTGEHESLLKREFVQLKGAIEADDLPTVRAAVHEVVHKVTESYDSLKQAHALVIAQLQDEIRVLQSELQRGQRKPELPLGVQGKRAFEQAVEDLLRHDRAFVALLATVSGHRELFQNFPREKVENALAGFVAVLTRLAQQHSPKATVAAWAPHVYAVAIPAGIPLQDWHRELATSHVFRVDGLPRTLRITPHLEIVERASGESPTLFFDRLSKAAGNLT
jgi:hypothetical protein